MLGELDGRISPRVRELAALLGAVEPTRVTDNVMGYKWAKLIYASLLFATAVVDAHVYDVIERSPEVQRALCALVGEGLAVADKAGIRIDPFDEFDPAWYRAALHGDETAMRRAMDDRRGALPGQHEDQDRRLARSRRAPAQDGGGWPARACSRARARPSGCPCRSPVD